MKVNTQDQREWAFIWNTIELFPQIKSASYLFGNSIVQHKRQEFGHKNQYDGFLVDPIELGNVSNPRSYAQLSSVSLRPFDSPLFVERLKVYFSIFYKEFERNPKSIDAQFLKNQDQLRFWASQNVFDEVERALSILENHESFQENWNSNSESFSWYRRRRGFFGYDFFLPE